MIMTMIDFQVVIVQYTVVDGGTSCVVKYCSMMATMTVVQYNLMKSGMPYHLWR